jgi:hypothetical protein
MLRFRFMSHSRDSSVDAPVIVEPANRSESMLQADDDKLLPQSSRRLWSLRDRAFWFAASVTAIVFVANFRSPQFSPDSWSYFELSKSVFRDFYRANTIQRFETHSAYCDSFPPAWPTVLAVARKILDVGIYTGYLLNFFICIGLLASLELFLTKLRFPSWVGVACYLCVLGLPGFREDALAARAIPLSLFLLVLALLFVFSNQRRAVNSMIAGAVMGLNCLTRFDALPMALVLGVAIGVQNYRSTRSVGYGLSLVSAYLLALAVVFSPWSIYGLIHFGRLFPSGASWLVKSARGGHVTDYFEHSPPNELFHNNWAWIVGLFQYKSVRVGRVVWEAIRTSVLPGLACGTLLIWAGRRASRWPSSAVHCAVFGLSLIIAMLIPSILIGYGDTRYYSGALLVAFIMLFGAVVSMTPLAWTRGRVATLLVLIACWPITNMRIPELVPLRETVRVLCHPAGLFEIDSSLAPLLPTAEMQRVSEAVSHDSNGKTHRILITDNDNAARYGAMTSEPTSFMPDLVGGTFASFVRTWGITHLYDPENKLIQLQMPGVRLIPLSVPRLYRIQLDETLP